MTARYMTCEAEQFECTMPTEPTEPAEPAVPTAAAMDEALIACTQPLGPQPLVPQSSRAPFEIVDYSERAVAIFGNTFPLKDELRKVGAKFNPNLKDPLEPKRKIPGWILSKRKFEVTAWLKTMIK